MITLSATSYDFIPGAIARMVKACDEDRTIDSFSCDTCGQETSAFAIRRGPDDANLTAFLNHVGFEHAGRANVLVTRLEILFRVN